MFKPRLKRLERLHTSNPIYFITACTKRRVRILDDPDVHHGFLEFASRAMQRKVNVGRYMIMPDHLHFFVAFSPNALSLSLWMKSLKNSLSKVLRKKGFLSPHWQKDFFDHLMRSDESYQQKWEYVVLNPVRAGLVANSVDWLYQGEISHLRSEERRVGKECRL